MAEFDMTDPTNILAAAIAKRDGHEFLEMNSPELSNLRIGYRDTANEFLYAHLDCGLSLGEISDLLGRDYTGRSNNL